MKQKIILLLKNRYYFIVSVFERIIYGIEMCVGSYVIVGCVGRSEDSALECTQAMM